MKTVIEIPGGELERELRVATRPMLVHFHASWSGRCQILESSLATLVAEMGDELQIARLNLDRAPELAARYSITDVPTLLLFDGGAAVARLNTTLSPRQLKARLQGLLADYAPLA